MPCGACQLRSRGLTPAHSIRTRPQQYETVRIDAKPQIAKSYTVFAVGRVSKDGQCDFDGEPNVQYTRRRDEALHVANALLVPGRRILVQDLDTGGQTCRAEYRARETDRKVFRSAQRQLEKAASFTPSIGPRSGTGISGRLGGGISGGGTGLMSGGGLSIGSGGRGKSGSGGRSITP
jgi:hypothetical protein